VSPLIEEFDRVRSLYPARMSSSLVVPLLQIVQERNGHVTDADAALVASYVGVPTMQVQEALRWYTMLQRQPTGRHVIKVCRNISCSLRGAERVLAHITHRLGIEAGETTPDGRFTVIEVECLASCGTAPAMQIDETYHEELDEARIDAILKGLA
jgi:NADH-quinone oxidoreductase subunit E